MRLFLIPISARRTLIYGQRLNKITHAQPSLADKASTRASQLWLKWESAEKGWQKRVTEYGNKLFNRIPFEEWGLKSIPPLSARRQADEIAGAKIEVVYPPSIISSSSVAGLLSRLSTERNAVHRKRLIWSLIGMPISAPFALVPVIPNLPFFYLAYRAFSHWKALEGAKHLGFLAANGMFQPVPSAALDEVYTRHRKAVTIDARALKAMTSVEWTTTDAAEVIKKARKQGPPVAEEEDVLLLREQDAQDIAQVVDVPALVVECERACRQVAAQMQLQAEQESQTIRVDKANESAEKKKL
ncbi:mitochondrial K+-H+ exchange-related-domain-containing protein [Tricharina praecox]|uniref:mitochondrial K+-H+ exchange-related-domain-containing protein n=1 Tax=Tricharina praecox TaxID=43433 RepID=UPI002220412A|nr:mitochondrial K+-H+ exchange-related-domain-containing protein [Tricharina praecox]KAI5842863.1 mitochondrial K+-H+ exchange-related-domain-containing protein [Tricharina praecox]